MAVDYCVTCKHDTYRHHTPEQRIRYVTFRNDDYGSISISGDCPHGRGYNRNEFLSEDMPLADLRTFVEDYDLGCDYHKDKPIEWCDDCDCSGYDYGDSFGFGVTTGPGFSTFLELPPERLGA